MVPGLQQTCSDVARTPPLWGLGGDSPVKWRAAGWGGPLSPPSQAHGRRNMLLGHWHDSTCGPSHPVLWFKPVSGLGRLSPCVSEFFDDDNQHSASDWPCPVPNLLEQDCSCIIFSFFFFPRQSGRHLLICFSQNWLTLVREPRNCSLSGSVKGSRPHSLPVRRTVLGVSWLQSPIFCNPTVHVQAFLGILWRVLWSIHSEMGSCFSADLNCGVT